MKYGTAHTTLEGIYYTANPNAKAEAVLSNDGRDAKAKLEKALSKKILGYDLTEEEKELILRFDSYQTLFEDKK